MSVRFLTGIDPDGAIDASAGITGLDVSNGISGNNFNIVGVNELKINDPGEGINFHDRVILKVIDDSTDNKIDFTGATQVQVNGNIVATQAWVSDQNFLSGSASYLPLSGGTLTGNLTVPSVDTETFYYHGTQWYEKKYVRAVGLSGGAIGNSWVLLGVIANDASYERSHAKFTIHGYDDVSSGTEIIIARAENNNTSQEIHQLNWYSNDSTANLFSEVQSIRQESNGLQNVYEVWVKMAGDWRDTFTVSLEWWNSHSKEFNIDSSTVLPEGETPNVGVDNISQTTRKWYIGSEIFATGGDSNQWNTAYGWGNHAGLYDAAGAADAVGQALNERIDTEVLPLIDTKADASHTHDYLPLAGGTLTGALTINHNGDAINLRSTTNSQPSRITFSSDVPADQVGYIEYSHVNTASYGSGESFVIGGNQANITILADGKLMYNEGIYSKPASGTGAGTRKDANWDTAYGWGNHADEGYITGVNWADIGAGTRRNYDLDLRPPSSGYAGFTFTRSDGNGAGYLLVRGTTNNDVYTANGITLVADGNWLTLAQRTSSAGVRIMTGVASKERLLVKNDGKVAINPTDSGGFDAVLTVGSGGDGRIQTRHIWGKRSDNDNADNLYINYQNTGKHVQIGDVNGGNNLYVSGDIYANGFLSGNKVATESHVSSNYLPLIGGKVSRNGMLDVQPASYSYINGSHLELYTTDNHVPAIGFHRGGVSATTLYEEQGELFITKWDGSASGVKMWHSGDFDPGSFLTKTAKAADSNLLDGINSTSFLRSDTDDSASGNLSFTGKLNIDSPGQYRVFHAKATRAAGLGTGSAGSNTPPFLFENTGGDQAWGIVAEFRLNEDNRGGDSPAILFSDAQQSTQWTVGFDYTGSEFGIRKNRGIYSGGWGTSYMKINTSGNTWFYGNVDADGNIASGGTVRSQNTTSLYAQLESNASGGVVKGSGGGGFLIRSYGDTYFNGGKLGIGTSSPTNARVHIVGNGSYVGDYGYNTLTLDGDNGYPGLNFRQGDDNWLIRKVAVGASSHANSMQFVFSTNANGPGAGSYDKVLQLNPSGSAEFLGDAVAHRGIYPINDRTQWLGLDTNRWQIVFCEILDSAGQHEKNLQNPEGEKSVGEYETGTVLVWKGGKNVPCTEYADHMRMGIAVKGIDSPLIQGAEPVLVTGPVNEGDYLVTSRKEGHAEAMSPEMMRQQNLFDCVIGKALESGEGESYLIKTWINI